MAEIIKRKKALSVSPLKSSAPMGASLAFLGIKNAIPLMHGSQGCAAFGKIFFVRHFREPVPLQTTAMDQISSVMGAEKNIVEGLKTLCEKAKPAMIGLPSTGLSETQGVDMNGAVNIFREKYPEHAHVKVIPVNTPDFSGCLETGYAAAIFAMIKALLPMADEAKTKPGRRHRQVNVLASAMLTPGDVENIKEILMSFGLHPIVLPDLSDSLDGHLTENSFNPLTIGGLCLNEFETMGDSIATITIGASMYKSAELLQQRTGVPDTRFEHLMGLENMDRLIQLLHSISRQAVPETYQRQRSQLQDTMLDTHFMLGQVRFAIAGDADLLKAFADFVVSMGSEVVAAVIPSQGEAMNMIPADEVKIGDLEDLEQLAAERSAEILIGNSHAVASAQRLGVPIVRVGFPQYDLVGGYQRTWVGYRGSRQALFDMANLLLTNHHHEIKPYRSSLAQKPQYHQSEAW